MEQPILQLKEISKIYPGVTALSSVSLDVKQGEIHALLGENGAGKSTLIKVITGAIEPTEGSIVFLGKERSSHSPLEAISAGIGAVYQEFNLVPSLNISDNIFYGREFKNGIFNDFARMNTECKAIFQTMGFDIDPLAKVSDLSVGYQQIVEIAKWLTRDVQLLILDEPTAPLTDSEIDVLFKLVLKLKEKGVTIIFITHRLDELFRITDRVTVMRDGCYVATYNTVETTKQLLVNAMVGRELLATFPKRDNAIGEPILRADHLSTSFLKDISFELRRGEILGFAGLVGAGRTETARALFGADALVSGSIFLDGKTVLIDAPMAAIRLGMGLIPEDRKQHGVLLELSVRENITFASLKNFSRWAMLLFKKEKAKVAELIGALKIKTPSDDQKVKNLSGGNQQKVVLAKWMATKCRILIFDEPTRGIDVGAKHEIYKLMRKLTAEGKSIIMISSEMPELLGMSDRIVVMHEGTIVSQLDNVNLTQERILSLASGHQ